MKLKGKLNKIIDFYKMITFDKIVNFVESYLNMLMFIIFDDIWRKEQVEWRTEQVEKRSKECITSKACVHCHCTTPDKFWEPDPCDLGCYPEWMTKEQWAEFKKVKDKIQY